VSYRKPGDGSFFGGNLSRPFRKLLFCQFLIHLAAQFVFKDKDSVLYSTSLYWSCIGRLLPSRRLLRVFREQPVSLTGSLATRGLRFQR